MKICPFCGNQVEEFDFMCPKCGNELTTGLGMEEKSTNLRNKSWLLSLKYLPHFIGLLLMTYTIM